MTVKYGRIFVLAAAMALVVASIDGVQANSEEDLAKENFLQADADEDGVLTADEFETMIDLHADDDLGRTAMIRDFGRYEMAFDRADENGDGVVSPEELAAMAR